MLRCGITSVYFVQVGAPDRPWSHAGAAAELGAWKDGAIRPPFLGLFNKPWAGPRPWAHTGHGVTESALSSRAGDAHRVERDSWVLARGLKVEFEDGVTTELSLKGRKEVGRDRDVGETFRTERWCEQRYEVRRS